jgi:protein-tyrosine-phosphatase
VSQPEPDRAGYEAITPAYRLLEMDHPTALASAEKRLRREFATVFDFGTVHRLLYNSYDRLGSQATVTLYLPLLAERFGRHRLQALAKAEGRLVQPKPVVLFLCTHNAGRSQMALGFFTRYAQDRAVAWSGGSEPAGSLNPAAVEAMAEVGIDITQEYPKPWTDEVVRAADIIVTLGCGDTCPLLPGTRYEDWIVDDPAGLPLAEVRPIRDDLGQRIQGLLSSLDIAAAT